MITLSTIVITGKILKSIYESDSPPVPTRPVSSSSKPSQWVSNEYESRKKDADEKATLKRFKEEEKVICEKFEKRKEDFKDDEKYKKYVENKSKERKKDLEMLKKMLKNKGLEPVGLDVVPDWYVDPDPVPEVKEPKATKTEVKVEKKKEVKVADPAKLTMGDKIRQTLLGKNLAAARKREKASATSAAVIMAPGTAVDPAVAAVPERGPGWEVASDPTTAAGLAKSAGNAEALARGMGR